MKTCFLFLFAAGSALAFADEGPSVRDVTMSPPDARGCATVSYVLENAPAVITLDVRQGDVSIGGEKLIGIVGAVNRPVQPGSRTITWNVQKACPGQSLAGLKAVVTAWPTNAPPDYMTVSLKTPGQVRYYPCAEQLPGGTGATNDLYKTEYLLFRRIPAAGVRWRMGSPTSPTEKFHAANETTHYVTLADDFYLGVFPVTTGQHAAIKNGTVPTLNDAKEAASRIAYNDLRGTAYSWPTDLHKVDENSVLGKLRKHVGGGDFDFPGEAEWEFACRAGTSTAMYNGKDVTDEYWGGNDLGTLAAWTKNYGGESTKPGSSWVSTLVGRFLPNGYGLYDMLGNVSEWCRDWYEADITNLKDPNLGPATSSTNKRAARNGNCATTARYCRAAVRGGYDPSSAGSSDLGFRIWCPAVTPLAK